MSGKNTKKKSKNSRVGLVVVIVIIALVGAAFAWAVTRSESEQVPTQTPSETSTVASQEQTVQTDDQPTETEAEPTETEPQTTETVTKPTETVTQPTQAPTEDAQEPTKPVQIEELEPVSVNLGSGLTITDVGKYTGVYMEDGSDEVITGIMMIAVTNEGEQAVQYAEISVPVGDEMAYFTLSTLPAGATVILLEQSRMEYVPGEYVTAVAENVALFKEPLDLREDQVKIQNLQGAVNISNISDGEIEGDICIYYKNSAADVYYGGITYRVRLEGGLKAGEIKQIVASHFSQSGTAIMFVTCGEA